MCWQARSPPRRPGLTRPGRTHRWVACHRPPRRRLTPNAQPASYLFHDEFDGPAGSAPDPSKWTVAPARELIKNPVFWDRPENMGQYRDDRRNVFLDGNSNLVIRATKEGGKYFGGKIRSTWWGGIGHTWEARVKLNCLTAGCWPSCRRRRSRPGRMVWQRGVACGNHSPCKTGRHIIRDQPDGCGQRVAHMARHME